MPLRVKCRCGQELVLHGWIYGIKDGLLRDLDATVTNLEEMGKVYETAIAAVS